MSNTEAPRKKRSMKAKSATVTGIKQISPELIRLSFDCPDIIGADLAFTDHYIKILFVPEGADYSWPFDLAEISETKPRDQHPVRRTYTFRTVDTVAGTFDVDFVAHGSDGLAGPWAQQAKVGDTIAFVGPGGAWKPESDYEHFVLAGDEAAAPAIFAGLENLPDGTTATAYIEISSSEARFDAPTSDNIEVVWVPRDGATHGTLLIDALRNSGYPSKKTSWFIHGVAEMVKETRKFLFVEGDVEKEDASISGYWRLGMTEDQWQASKMEFNAENEAEEQALAKAK
ncbi:siderophore-interacting iron utilization protein [Corynebacterium suranareeae]|uniref:Siderophore-interacting iron utilization protein n=1 Tax=Corynebacterium suranareeae TaxID=2506452 RepID=A0A160PRY6_9CORY|nr:siderophore-interacting protein [Corynebacterium suranareeae]BAU95631.1 siderophore-interacting iron utilization protein [Corynebacterium suranareeae]